MFFLNFSYEVDYEWWFLHNKSLFLFFPGIYTNENITYSKEILLILLYVTRFPQLTNIQIYNMPIAVNSQ